MNIYYYGELISSDESSVATIKKPKFSLKHKARYLLAGFVLLAGLSLVSKCNQNLNSRLEQVVNVQNQETLNNLVQIQVEKYKSDSFFIDNLKSSFSELSRYNDEIVIASKKSRIPVNLLYAKYSQESGGELRAGSLVGAKGVTQIMKPTAKEMEIAIDDFVDERYSPKVIPKSAKYFRKYIKSNKAYLLLAAYNGGPTMINKIIKNSGEDWDTFSKDLYKETFDYVVIIKARWQLLDEGIEFEKKKLFSQEGISPFY